MSASSWIVIPGFTSGKTQSRKASYQGPRRFPEVVAIAPEAIDRILRTRSWGERMRVLREMRDTGLLIAPAKGGRLQHKVRGGQPPLPERDGRFYVFATSDIAPVINAADRIRKSLR